MSILKRAALVAVGRTPTGLRTWVYRHPPLWHPLARMIGGLVPAEQTVVQISGGPNAGLKLAIDRTTPRYYWLDANYESAVVAVLREWLQPGMCVADIGAHIGFMTLLMARAVGSGGKVLSVEPSPRVAEQLRQNVRLNRMENVTVQQKAIADAQGEITFAVGAIATTSHMTQPGEATPADAVRVPMVRVDDLVFGSDGSGQMDVMKIDVEGAEPAVLRGASRVLAELRPKLLIEIHTPVALGECLLLLDAARYDVSAVTASEYYSAAIATRGSTELADSGFIINHLRCVPR